MSDKIYFYLEGSEKKGPFSKEEIIDLNLPKETLVFTEKNNKWLPISSLKEFKKEKVKSDKKIKIPSIVILVLLFLASSAIAYYITENNRKSDYKLLKDKIASVFNGKTEIRDFSKTGVKGKLEKQTDNVMSSIFPVKDNEDKEIYEYYYCKSGGWTVYTLTDENLGYRYRYEESNSTNMGFKVPEFTESSWEIRQYFPNHKTPTYRGTVQEAYNESMKFLSVEKENKSYVAGSLNKILNFDRISTDYYSVSETQSWNGLGEGNVFNKNWIVWYKTNGKYYDIVKNEDNYNKDLLINILIGLGLSIFTFLIWKYGNRLSLKK